MKTEKKWRDDPPPGAAGAVHTRYRSPSVHGGWIEEEIQIYSGLGGDITRKYYRPRTDETGMLTELRNRQWRY